MVSLFTPPPDVLTFFYNHMRVLALLCIDIMCKHIHKRCKKEGNQSVNQLDFIYIALYAQVSTHVRKNFRKRTRRSLSVSECE